MTKQRAQSGFTLVEVLVALLILGIGLVGILGLHRSSATASGYSRRATEAAILAEDKLEELRTIPTTAIVNDQDQVDASGIANDEGLFTRTWDITWAGTLGTLVVTVGWEEADGAHAITYRTVRSE
jgi:type IV pilus assembly protein PilV